jgi:chromosome partitioning protein
METNMIISVSNQKGGVGKTTSVFALGTGLAAQGARVLLIDLDPQASLTISPSLEPDDLQVTIYDALVKGKSPPVVNLRERLDLIPANIDLSAAEMELVNEMGRERLLSDLLTPLSRRYDFVLIDCPPSLGLLTLNTLSAADSVLIPIQCEFYALEGLSQLLNTVTIVQKNLNPRLQIEGVLLTMYDGRLNLSRQVADEAKEYFGPKVYRTTIPRNVRIAEAPSFGKPIVLYDVASVGAKSYLGLAKEVIARKAVQAAPEPLRAAAGD